jgi:hypothetical protein
VRPVLTVGGRERGGVLFPAALPSSSTQPFGVLWQVGVWTDLLDQHACTHACWYISSCPHGSRPRRCTRGSFHPRVTHSYASRCTQPLPASVPSLASCWQLGLRNQGVVMSAPSSRSGGSRVAACVSLGTRCWAEGSRVWATTCLAFLCGACRADPCISGGSAGTPGSCSSVCLLRAQFGALAYPSACNAGATAAAYLTPSEDTPFSFLICCSCVWCALVGIRCKPVFCLGLSRGSLADLPCSSSWAWHSQDTMDCFQSCFQSWGLSSCSRW